MTICFWQGLGTCRILCYLYLLPMNQLRISAINFQSYFPRCKTKNHWCADESHFQIGVASVPLLFLISMAPNTSKKRQRHTEVNSLQLTAGYLSTSTNWRTWIADFEIETEGLCHNWRNQWVDRYCYVFVPPRGCGDGSECGHSVDWFRVERGQAARTLVHLYVSIWLNESQWVWCQ
jgi:hypothetical protein